MDIEERDAGLELQKWERRQISGFDTIKYHTCLTQDTTWESDKNTIKHHIQESQEVSPFSAGDHKAAMNR